MKLSDLLEIEYGSQYLLADYEDQIKKISHEQYRKLQLMMSQQQDNEVAKWIKNALKSGQIKDIPDDAPPNDKAIPLSLGTTSYEADALNEKIKSFIKKEIGECWKSYKQVGVKKKGNKTVPNCVPKNENLRNWFKKEKWKRIDTQGNIAGDCGTMPKGKKTQRCLPQAKAQSLTKKQRAATSRKKTKSNKQFVSNTKAAK